MKLKVLLSVLVFSIGFMACGGGSGSNTSSSAAPSNSVAENPVFSIVGDTYLRGQRLAITNPATTGTIYVTTDGSAPTLNSSLSAATQVSITLNDSMTVKAIIVDGTANSETVVNIYTVVTDSSVPTPPLLASANYDYSESFDPAGDLDYFRTDVIADMKYVVDTCDDNGTTLDGRLYLFSDTAMLVSAATDVFEGTAFDGKASQLVYKKTADATYCIKHVEEADTQINDYLVRIYTPESQASTITPGDMSGTLIGYESTLNKCSRKFYSFYGTAGVTYSIFTYRASDIDTAIALYNSAFNGVEDMDDDTSLVPADCAHCSSISFTPATSDTYYFMVKGANDTQTGTYEVYVGY
jgi:hypothetical protein